MSLSARLLQSLFIFLLCEMPRSSQNLKAYRRPLHRRTTSKPCMIEARRLARAALQRALQHLLNAEARDVYHGEKTVRNRTKASLMALNNVIYVGFTLAKTVDTRVQTHIKNYRRAGARIGVFISRRRKDGGQFEQELIDYFKANQARTWEARGLVNLRKSRDKGKTGFVYVLVRVQ